MLQVIIMSPAQDRREWLQTVLRASPVIQVVGVASTFPYLRSLIDETPADVAVIDLQAIADAGIYREWVLQISDLIAVVLQSSQPDRFVFEQVLHAGAGALLGSEATAEQIIHAIEGVSAGLITFDGRVV